MPTKAELEKELEDLKAKLEETEAKRHGEEATEEDDDRSGPFLTEDGVEITQEEIDLFREEVTGHQGNLVVDGYRYRDETDGKCVFIKRWEYPDFSLPKVQKELGGGRWNFRVRTRKGKHVTSGTVEIEGKYRGPQEAREEDDPRTYADRMMDSLHMMHETLEEVRKGPPPNLQQPDPLNMAMSIIGAFNQVTGPIQQEIRELRKGGEGPSFRDMLEIFERGMDFGGRGGSSTDPMAAVLATTLPQIAQALGARTPAGADPLDILRNPPGENMTDEAKEKGFHGPRPTWDMMISPVLPQLLRWARAGKDPEFKAQVVVDDLTPEIETILLRQLRRGPEFFAEVMVLHPEAEPYRQWLAAFWVAVADLYEWGSEEMGPHPFREDAGDIVDLAQEAPTGETSPEEGTEVH